VQRSATNPAVVAGIRRSCGAGFSFIPGGFDGSFGTHFAGYHLVHAGGGKRDGIGDTGDIGGMMKAAGHVVLFNDLVKERR